MLRRSSAFQSSPTASNSWENRLRRRLSAYMRKGPQPAQRAKLFMRFYPPLFFQRVVPLYVAPDYSVAHIKVKRSLLTINLNGSFFGGTIMAAIDPWYGMLIAQKAAHENIPVEVWVQEMNTYFHRATRGSLYFTCAISPEMWAEIRQRLLTEGRFRYPVAFEIFGSEGYLCASGVQTLYLRNLHLHPRLPHVIPARPVSL
jgi:acyl-coenzyme A thioesterase PaaI-like protein